MILRKSFALIALFISFFLAPQSISNFNSKDGAEKLISWLQFFLLEEEDIALEYRSLSLRNGMLEISNLSITDFIYPSDFDATKVNSLDQLLAANENTASETVFSAKKIKINLGYIEKFLTLVMTRDKDMIKEFYKDSKKVSNKKIKEKFKLKLIYPTYEEGLKVNI